MDDILYDLAVPVKSIGIQVEAANTEYGPGQFEISMKPFRGLFNNHVTDWEMTEYAELF
ncbi:MAG: hypothetical protein ACYCYO_17235 [Bacilli bacterium]